MKKATAGVTMIPGITFAGTFEPDGTGTYKIIGAITKADGLHIVRAVNAHDALVEALKAASDVLHDLNTGESVEGERVTLAADKAREAIAKAEGKP